ncbi:MAG: methyltransferase domain-containing protein [Acidobacteriaceae bacterium]|nr:methyltransferase domain-containing protein [Acidobacteriaceae bacterium]
MSANKDDERFNDDAEKYAAYLGTPEGRLRLDLAFTNLQEYLPQATRPLRALDIGGGTGAIALRLARLGFHVTVLDSSLSMLDLARQAAQEAGVTDKIAITHGEAADLESLFPTRSFDFIVCHNVLEFVDDPANVLCLAARAMRNRSAVISVLVRNHAGEVLKAAIHVGDLVMAERTLSSEWGEESLYGGRVRLFTPDGLRTVLNAASLAVIAERGVRVFSDYLPPQVCRTADYERILQLEHKLGRRPEFAAIARYSQFLVRSADI